MSTIRPETIKILSRYTRNEAAKRDHIERYPEWWARQGTGHADLPEAEGAWSALCAESVGAAEVLEAVREVLAVASVRCLVHEDCLSPLAVACAATPDQSTEGGGT